MKILSACLLVFASTFAFADSVTLPASPVVVDFFNSSQIVGSRFAIHMDGTVEHTERTCCPPVTHAVSETPLTKAEMGNVLGLISNSATGIILIQLGSATALGSQAGYLRAYEGSVEVTILDVERSTKGPGGRNLVNENQAPAAKALRTLVEKYVANPLIP